MIVVKVCMWPGGDPAHERVECIGLIDFQAQAKTDDASLGVRQGERAYRVRLLKMPQFGGPDGSDPERLRAPRASDVWREGYVRGHQPGPRGAWDLLGGALAVLLGSRLGGYVRYGGAPAPARDAPIRCGAKLEDEDGRCARVDGHNGRHSLYPLNEADELVAEERT